MMHLRDARFAFVTEQLWMDVMALVPRGFVYFHLDAVRVGPGVLTDAGDLPGNFHTRLAAAMEAGIADHVWDLAELLA
jgi:hypothetical protein